MFPQRLRAMMLDGIVDPVAYIASAEARAENNAASSDEVFDQFLTLCDQAGPTRCALAGHGETAAQRVNRLVERAKKAPIPAPDATPPGPLYAGDLPVSTFAPMRDPGLWPDYAKQLNAAVDGDVSALTTAAQQARTLAAWDEATKSSAISCLDGPATKPIADWPAVIAELTTTSRIAGPVQGWWLWAPCAADWPAHSDDRYTGPWNTKTTTPILLIGTRYDPQHRLPERRALRATRQRRAAHPRRLRPPQLQGHQRVRRADQSPLPRRPADPTGRHGVPRRQGPVLAVNGACGVNHIAVVTPDTPRDTTPTAS
jgi:hypothetical protein